MRSSSVGDSYPGASRTHWATLKGYVLVQVILVVNGLIWRILCLIRRILFLVFDRLKVKCRWPGNWLFSRVVFLDCFDVIGMMIDVVKHSLI